MKTPTTGGQTRGCMANSDQPVRHSLPSLGMLRDLVLQKYSENIRKKVITRDRVLRVAQAL
jgi:hypothetical protein